MGVLRPIGHAERLSIVDHLDEFRTRLIWCLVVFVGAFSLCYWQNEQILEIVNRPLEESQQPGKGSDPLEQAARYDRAMGKALADLAPALNGTQAALAALAAQPGVDAAARAQAVRAGAELQDAARQVALAARIVPKDTGRRAGHARRPPSRSSVTFTVAGYAALLLSLPFILWQAYALFACSARVRPARTPGGALPLMAMVPVSCSSRACCSAYYVALPRAVDFLQNFNDDAFDILIQARDYYRFVVVFLALMGLVFRFPSASWL